MVTLTRVTKGGAFVSVKPMHHPARFVRPLSTLIGRVECGKCGSYRADVCAIAFGRRLDRYEARLTIEAVCGVCGYQTIYYEQGK